MTSNNEGLILKPSTHVKMINSSHQRTESCNSLKQIMIPDAQCDESDTTNLELNSKEATRLQRFHIQRSQSSEESYLTFYKDENESNSFMDKESSDQSKNLTPKSLRLLFCGSNDAYIVFLKNHKCFELMPTSGKVVVLDSSLSIKKAFYALVYNNTRAAIISTVDKKGIAKFTGVLSISDFIEILTIYYRSKDAKIREFEELTIRSWKNQLNSSSAPRSIRSLPGISGGGATKYLVHIAPDLSLFDTFKIIEQERVHRVPIINPQTNDFLYFVTMKRILRFMFLAIYNIPRPAFLDKSIDELGLGTYCIDGKYPYMLASSTSAKPTRTYKKIHLITTRTSVIDALRMLVRTGVSALPVVDRTGRLRDLFSRFDVIHLAASGTYTNLNRSVEEALQSRGRRIEAVLCCHTEESLITVMVRMVTGQVHRLVIVDKTRRVIGILSLSDLMSFLTQIWTG